MVLTFKKSINNHCSLTYLELIEVVWKLEKQALMKAPSIIVTVILEADILKHQKWKKKVIKNKI